MYRELFKEDYLRFFRLNLPFIIPSCIPLHSHIFVSVKILTKKVDLDNNSRNESHKFGCEKCVQVVNLGPEKRVYNKIFLIVSYNYKNYGFLS